MQHSRRGASRSQERKQRIPASTAEKTTRGDRVRQRIRGDILCGRLRPGEKLAFAELCERYDASVGVVREALMWLASQGLVRTQPHQGHIVSPLSTSDLAELAEARLAIEPMVLRRALEEGSVEWEARVVSAHHVLSRTSRTDPDDGSRASEEWITAHEAFHDALFSGCTNERLLRITSSLAQEAALYRRWSVPHEADRDVAAEHEALVAACVGRDADRAEQLLRSHITTTAKLLTTLAESSSA